MIRILSAKFMGKPLENSQEREREKESDSEKTTNH